MALTEEQKAVAQRMRVESFIRAAKESENQASLLRKSLERELHMIQQDCKHEDVKVDGSWQGGGLYYDHAHCQICNKKESRYNRELTLQENRKWHKNKSEEEIQAMTPKESGCMFGKYDW